MKSFNVRDIADECYRVRVNDGIGHSRAVAESVAAHIGLGIRELHGGKRL